MTPDLEDLLLVGLSGLDCKTFSLVDLLRTTPGPRPDIIVLAADGQRDTLVILDLLRTHPWSAPIPVVAMLRDPHQREQALASGNVCASLPLPIDDLLRTIRAEAQPHSSEGLQNLPLKVQGAFHRAADILAETGRQLSLDWAQLIGVDSSVAANGGGTMAGLLGEMPRIIHTISRGFRYQNALTWLEADGDLLRQVRTHAARRQAQALPVGALMREFQVLRSVIVRHLAREMPSEELMEVSPELHSALDQVMQLTVTEYLRLAGR